MNKYLTSLVLALLLTVTLNAKEKTPNQLTTEQKLSDFNSLYTQLKEAYPFFGINKRQNNIDWLENYELYCERIKETKDDKEFLTQIESIINDLNNAHADLLPTKMYKYFLRAYRIGRLLDKSYKIYVTELKKNGANKKCEYWQSLYKELHPKKSENEATSKNKDKNIHTDFIKDSSIAIINIKSFGYEHINKDKKSILDFYSQLEGYENLIIDIQGNGGGISAYWQDILVPFLSDTILPYQLHMAYKDTPGFYKFAGDNEDDAEQPENYNFSNLPPEVDDGTYKFLTIKDAVRGHKKSIHFKGNIYLLADDKVFSSAEAFIYFCKATGFAEIAGTQTGGSGIGSDPFLFTLPISGIVVRYPGIMGLNLDGSSNDEFGTVPDIHLSSKIKADRLNELKMYIEKKKHHNNVLKQ